MADRLADSASPYLLQHRDQPVDWWPWCDEAFEEARRRDVPVFLSIGYATCHWCHVMAHESFDRIDVAHRLNDGYVSIKVDREERPDVDELYMSVCQAVRGRCGWPLTLLLTAERRPFFVATYLPPTTRHGRPGLLELLERVYEIWTTDRAGLLASAEDVADHITPRSLVPSERPVSAAVFRQARAELAGRYDPVHGGFGGAPRFPSPHVLIALFRSGWRFADDAAVAMARDTIVSMSSSGIFDQVGFGFHRYSTDAEWRLPHFEKMLYDQAWMLTACAEGWLATGDERLRTTGRQTATYLLRDLRSEDGTFYSGEDADSEGEEGRFYLWDEDELERALGPDDAALARRWFGTAPDGNYEDEAMRRRTGLNVLHPRGGSGAPSDDDAERIRSVLLAWRSGRERPMRDEKILTDWNGLAVAALARAGRAFGDRRLVDAAVDAVSALLDRHVDSSGRLMHRGFHGRVGIDGLLDDHAALADALIELYQATFDIRWLSEADRLAGVIASEFAAEDGTYYQARDTGGELFVRPRALVGGAMPSGNALTLGVFARLAAMTGQDAWRDRAERLIAAVSTLLESAAGSLSGFLLGAGYLVPGGHEIVLAGDLDDPRLVDLRATVDATYAPWSVVLHRPVDESRLTDVAGLQSRVAPMKPVSSVPTAYVCRGFVCDAPATTPKALRERLRADTGSSPDAR